MIQKNVPRIIKGKLHAETHELCINCNISDAFSNSAANFGVFVISCFALKIKGSQNTWIKFPEFNAGS